MSFEVTGLPKTGSVALNSYRTQDGGPHSGAVKGAGQTMRSSFVFLLLTLDPRHLTSLPAAWKLFSSRPRTMSLLLDPLGGFTSSWTSVFRGSGDCWPLSCSFSSNCHDMCRFLFSLQLPCLLPSSLSGVGASLLSTSPLKVDLLLGPNFPSFLNPF